uniref:Uncharacterized protein n=1 Tax=Daphnia galeata TaxID=27404 RepID=A0A8J2RZK6_9CRUS|nr:unnamed protein product [Daphnia galeata]
MPSGPWTNLSMDFYTLPTNEESVWAPANGEVERIMQPIKKMVRTTTVEGRNWKDGLERFLFSPAKLLFNRELKILLPEVPQENADHLGDHHRQARINYGEAKRKIGDYANDNRNRKPSTLQVGYTVLLRNEKKLKNKMAPAFFPQPLMITKTKGSMITASSKNKIITRNSSFFKPYNCGDPVTLDSDVVQAPIPPALQIPHQSPAHHGNETIEADNFPPITSDEEEDEPQNPGPPERRGLRPRRRPDPLHYVGKGIQGKKQDNN